jgi:polyhydroxybutyrate depolymerase
MTADSASRRAARRGPWRVVRSRCVLLGMLLVLACGGNPPAERPAGATPQAADPSAGCRPGTSAAMVGERRQLAGRTVILDAPAAASDRPAPLVLALHGFRGSPDDMRDGTGLSELARTDGVVVAYPQGHDGVELLGTIGVGWDMRPAETTDRDFVRDLLDQLERERCIDRRRIYVTGMSNGGFLASLLGCQLADRLAAVAPVAGALDLGDCAPARPVPILLVYGTADTVVPPDLIRGGIAWWTRRNACGASAPGEGCTRWSGCAADVVACEGPQAHRWPPDATARIWHFFSAHARP